MCYYVSNMPVEFEEESFSFNNQNTQAVQYEQKVQEKSQPENQITMLFFAAICIVAAFLIPKFFNSSQPKEVVYFEDLTEARMRLVPENEREAFISGLPSKSNINK